VNANNLETDYHPCQTAEVVFLGVTSLVYWPGNYYIGIDRELK
jgi:hypothetical protein